MKTAIGLSVILMSAPLCSHANLTLVQDPSITCPASLTCSVPTAAIGDGHLVVVGVTYFVRFGGRTLQEVKGGGAYRIPNECRAFGFARGTLCAYVLTSKAGATSVDVTFNSAPSGGVLEAREYAYTASSISVDAIAAANDGPCTACSGVPLSLTGTNDVIVQFVSVTSNVLSITPPYANLSTNGNAGFADLLNTTSGTPPVWSQSSLGPASVAALAFREN